MKADVAMILIAPPAPAKAWASDLTVLQNHELRVDRDIAAGSVPCTTRDGRADFAVTQLDHLRSGDLI